MTKSQFAKELKISKPRISQLIKAGLPVGSDGSIDAKAALKWYRRNVGAKSEASKVVTVMPVSDAVESDAVEPATVELGTNGSSVTKLGAAEEGNDSYYEARRKREWLRYEKESLELARLTGQLVDAAEVEAAAFNTWRTERDALQNLPAQIAPIIAAELKIDEHQLYQTLEKHFRGFLKERNAA